MCVCACEGGVCVCEGVLKLKALARKNHILMYVNVCVYA